MAGLSKLFGAGTGTDWKLAFIGGVAAIIACEFILGRLVIRHAGQAETTHSAPAREDRSRGDRVIILREGEGRDGERVLRAIYRDN